MTRIRDIHEYLGTYYRIIYSPDDNGIYAEIFDADGKELYTTDIKGTLFVAEEAARIWIGDNTEQ